jgi:putative transport protein
LLELPATNAVAHAVGIIALVCVGGLALGAIKVRGVGLGVAGVLFAGIVVAHFGRPIDDKTLDFVRDFGLILFVFMIGLQLGPGFFATFKEQGVKMNVLATIIVLLGAGTAALTGWLAGFDSTAVLGIFSGGSVNMPSLGAATDALSMRPGLSADRLALPALACAVAFPTAVLASILNLVVVGKLFRIDAPGEAAEYAAKGRARIQPVERRTVVVTNPDLEGARIDQLAQRAGTGVTISHVRHDDETRPATVTTTIHLSDLVAAVGPPAALDALEQAAGRQVDDTLMLAGSELTSRRVVVTAREVLGTTVAELNLNDRFSAVITRVTRANIEMTAVPGLRLQFGDLVQIVGRSEDLDGAASALGNEVKELNETNFIPLFLGIAMGIVLGTLPLGRWWLPLPVRLGLAGGPLIVALVLGRIGRIGKLVCYMPENANVAFRDFGIALFFAAVGLESGANFFSTAFSLTGVKWLLAGAAVAIIPVLLVGIVARMIWRMNFMDLSGLMAGSSTNPPALAFAINVAGSNAPTLTYATVYPLAMLLRVLGAQMLALLLVK